ncbi:MAG: outer membrane lipoprotein-sorting protein [Xanthomonadales bacterium]|nr:outer membrane lipoprotein-sorting protein [Xanthomonadales bacterium]
MILAAAFWGLIGLAPLADEVVADSLPDATGRELMEGVYQRHRQYPYVFEVQSMVLIDRLGKRDTRKLRRYSRVDDKGGAQILLLFDSPPEVKGVALLAHRTPDDRIRKEIYLPALGRQLISNGTVTIGPSGHDDDHFLGTDFSIEDLTGESLADYSYRRRENVLVNEIPCYVVDVFRPVDDAASDPPVRRHFILQDGLYISRTDHFDDLGRLKKRQTHHDLVPVDGDMWRANMILMDNRAEDHQSIVKVDRRVFSEDYVPEHLFTAEWLYSNVPPPEEPDETPGPELDTAGETDEENAAP